MICENLFIQTNQDSTISFPWENSKMFNLILKYFSIFDNTLQSELRIQQAIFLHISSMVDMNITQLLS